MEEADYTVESEDEFYEDFGANLSDNELNQILIRARETSDTELRIVVKEVQYARFLMKHIVEPINDESELTTIQKLAKKLRYSYTKSKQ
ncbi:MAG: hypothetical protein HC846_04690 [Blastocatellia bacterium]|nr:hypothetical protein [Blastocatellia bacterium]